MIRPCAPKGRARGAMTRILKSGSGLPSLLSMFVRRIFAGPETLCDNGHRLAVVPCGFPAEGKTDRVGSSDAGSLPGDALPLPNPDPVARAPNPEPFGSSLREQCKSCRYWLCHRPPVAASMVPKGTVNRCRKLATIIPGSWNCLGPQPSGLHDLRARRRETRYCPASSPVLQ